MDDEQIAQQVGIAGRCVCPGFLTPAAVLQVRDDIERVKNLGGFNRAWTGQGAGTDVRNLVRRDSIHWLDAATTQPAQVLLLGRMDALKQAFNRQHCMGLWEFEGHYASYPVEGFYKRHLDAFRGDDARRVTVVLYLNRDWCAHDGGRLRVYGEDAHSDIDPVGGTLVCFLSRELEHEVLPSHAERHSFTGWFKTRQHLGRFAGA